MSPETPDFDQIARTFIDEHLQLSDYMETRDAVQTIAEQLRQVWNARGAADLAILEASDDIPAAGNLLHAIEQLNR